MKRLALIGVGIIGLVLGSALPSPAAPTAGWTTSVVDTADNDSPASVLAIRNTGTIWVGWQSDSSDQLWWADWKNSSWDKTQVTGGMFQACYDALANTDYGPAAGFKPTDGRARLASSCIGVSGPAYILWTSFNPRKKKWVTTTIGYAPSSTSNSTVTNIDLAFDPVTGNASVVFGDRGKASISWIHWTGSVWQTDRVVNGSGGFGSNGPLVSAAIDPTDNQPAIAYDSSATSQGGLSYLKYQAGSGTWTSTNLPGAIYGAPSLAFTPDGTPWIAYQQGSGTTGQLEVATPTAGVWKESKVDSAAADTGYSPSLALQGSLPRIAYHDQTNGDLRYATYDGATWTLSTVASTNDVGEYPSLAFTSGGVPEISYYDRTNTDIRWAHQ